MVTMLVEPELDACPLCERPNYFPSDHHLVPKSRGGTVTKTICCDCHRMIHSTFSNKELAKKYSTVAALLAHPTIAAQITFLKKQDPHRRSRMVRTKRRQNQRRYE